MLLYWPSFCFASLYENKAALNRLAVMGALHYFLVDQRYVGDHITCERIVGHGESHVLWILCLCQRDDFLHEGYELLRGIPASGLQSVHTFSHSGVLYMVVASCVFFLRVLATGFLLLVISCAHKHRQHRANCRSGG